MPGTSRTIAHDIPIIPSPNGASPPEVPATPTWTALWRGHAGPCKTLGLKRVVRAGEKYRSAWLNRGGT